MDTLVDRTVQCVSMNPQYVSQEQELECINVNQNRDTVENNQYFYHPDHLGSSSFITDVNGNVDQHLQYLPFGESFIDQRNSSWETPYTFSAKEKDLETGYSYFGARYYSPEISVWLSVDPKLNYYPNFSPYMYVVGNPVLYTDPNGKWVKGAGFFRNIFKSDARIHAEIRKKELAGQGIDASINKNREAGGWDVHYTTNDETEELNNGGATLKLYNVQNFSKNKPTKGNDISGEGKKTQPSIDQEVSTGIGISTTMLGEAARGINNPSLFKVIRNGSGVLGGIVGTVDNSYQAAQAFSKGNYIEGSLQTTQAACYATGTVMLFTPLAPIGAGIILVNSAIDIGEYFIKNW